jgi:hypothetical protein
MLLGDLGGGAVEVRDVVGQAREPLEGVHRLEVPTEGGIHLRAIHDGLPAVEVHELLQRQGRLDQVGRHVLDGLLLLGRYGFPNVSGEPWTAPFQEPVSELLRNGVSLDQASHHRSRIESTSIVNVGVSYEFRLPLPHCRACADTANRKRPGAMGMLAAFLAVAVPVGILMLGFGAASNRDWMIMSSFVVGAVAGIAVPYAWIRARRPRAGQSTRYQAVYASGVDRDGLGAASGFTLRFENPAYCREFLDLNRDAGVALRR